VTNEFWRWTWVKTFVTMLLTAAVPVTTPAPQAGGGINVNWQIDG
jgi:hypothetical protein